MKVTKTSIINFRTIKCLSILAIIYLISGTITAQTFKHPGIRNTKEELDLIKAKVNAGQQPWLSGYEKMMSNSVSSITYEHKPCDHFTFDTCRSRIKNDGAAAYSNALQWYIKGDTARAQKAITILNDWARIVRNFDQSCLAVTWGMPILINAAEIMRGYPGWSSSDQAKFKSWLSDIVWPFASDCSAGDRNNWDCGGIALSLAIAVFTDNQSRFDSSVSRLRNFIPIYIKETGCTTETDRDQGHAQMGIGHLAAGAEVAWHQGIDAWSFHDNRLFKGYELNAKYNLGESISCSGGVSSKFRGNFGHTMWEVAYNHYHNRKGMNMPYTKRAIEEKVRPEGLDNDMLPWGTLVHAEVGNGTTGGGGSTPTPTPTPTPSVTPTPSIDPSCTLISAGGNWYNTGLDNQNGSFTVEFDAKPSIATIDATIGLSNGVQTSYTGFAAIVRFNSAGNIDARNGAAYAAATAIPYAANTTYHFRLVVNVLARTYSAYVRPAGGTEKTIGSNYAFRTEQANVTNLNNWGGNINSSNGTLSVCNVDITSSTPAPVVVINEDCSSLANFTKVSGGTWGVSNGQCKLTATTTCTSPLCNILTHNTSVSGDFTLTAEASAVASTSIWDDVAIVFGYQDAQNYYYVSLNEGDDAGTNALFRVQAGTKTQLVDFGSNVTAPASTLHQIKIERAGSSIKVYKGATVLGTASDSTFTNGKVGFGAFNNSASFDNLKVTKP
jgi:hypothetical protein